MKTINSFRSKLFALTLALMASVSSFAYDFQNGYLFYNILDDGTVAVTSARYGFPYDYLPASLIIPSEVIGYNGETYIVTEIANYAFQGSDQLESVVIPNTVRKIGMYAFTGCSKLVDISFPESLEDVLGGALYECAWYNNQPDGLVYVGNLLYRYKGTAPAGTIVVRDGTKAILDFTFSNQPNIQSVILPESVTSIHLQAFGECNNLTTLVLPASIQKIERQAFENCTSLTEVTCYATIPPVIEEPESPSDWIFAGVDVANILLYVPAQSLGLYKNAEHWKEFKIRPYYSSEECDEYKNVNLSVVLRGKTSLSFYLSNNHTIEPPYVDSVWIFDTEFEPLKKFYAQSGDTIDLSFLEETGTYILQVYINGCILSRAFVYRIIPNKWKDLWCDTWNVLMTNSSLGPDEQKTTYRYQLAQDTVIGEQTYSVLTRYWTAEPDSKKEYLGAVRFANDRKVYANYNGKEYLVYDFSAEVGDTIEALIGVEYYGMTHKYLVHNKSIDPETNRTTITLHVYDEYRGEFIDDFDFKWIEGVGATSGFYEGRMLNEEGGGATHLLCAYQGDELKYTGPLYDKYGCEYNANDPQLPLVDWCNQWNILAHGYLGPREPLYGAHTTIYQLGEDTIINHQRYQQLTRYASDDVNQTKTYVGAIRFTKNNRQVYFYYDNAEYLLYDFKAQVGDTLEVFAGIDNYRDHKTYKHVVTNKEPIQDEQCKVTLDVFVQLELDGEIINEEKFTSIWIEGVGSPDGIVHNCATLREGNVVTDVLCAYVDDRRMYRTNSYTELGCVYNEGDFIEGAFPMLAGLQRTVCKEYYGETEDDNSANSTYKQTFDQIFFENDKPYILCNDYLLREEDNKILIYSQLLNKDLVLYDFTLEVGDSLPALYIDYHARNAMDWMPYNLDVVDYYKSFDGTIYPADTFIVTDISNVTLFDGKEYKKWTFNNGMEYVEGIGSFGNRQWSGDFFQLIANRDVPTSLQGEHLVCASKNNKLLYQMDDAEMERLGAECLCDVEKKWSETWCNQWNILSHGYLGPQDPLAGARTSIYWLSNNTVNRSGQEYIPLMCSSSMPNEESTHLVGELRFTEDKQVYFYYAFDETEYLLYDFGAELGDTLELFAGLEFYNYHKTYTHVITDKETLDDGRLQIQADVVIRIDNGAGEYFEEKHPVTWIEGLGSTYGIIFNPSNPGVAGDGAIIMLCAYRDDECVYTTNFSDYKNMGCVYNNDGTVDEDLFPMLAGLQRTVCNEYCEDSKTSLQKFEEIRFEHDQPYIYCYSAFLIREENNKILIYSHSLDKDLVLYDFTLEVGDSLPRLYLDESAEKDLYWIYYDIMNVVDYHKDDAGNILPADTLIVTDVSAITLLDGKEYKKWTFNNGMEYVEGIGSFGNNNWSGDFFRLIGNMGIPACLHGEHLVCASKNGQLLYQMDEEEMERLGAECLCAGYLSSYKDQWCDTWNVLMTNSSLGPDEQKTTYRYQLAQDIVIGDYTYTAVVSKAINDALDAPRYVAAVRFTDDRKVYIYYDNAEYLLYDFNVQEGEELEVFAGINNYTSEIKTYKCTVTGVEQYACVGCPATITLEVHNHPDDFREFYRQTQWIEGVGDINGFLNGINGYINIPGNAAEYLLCAYQGDELKYTGDLYEEYGCGDDAEQSPEDLFPTLWGLQRTDLELHTTEDGKPYHYAFDEYVPTMVNGKWYLYDGMNYLREENNQVLLYAPDTEIYEDIVLYDWTLEVGDTLPRPNISVNREQDYIVTDVSTITLLDGKEYKKWTLACGYEYIESIGAIKGHGYGLFLCLPHYGHLGTYIHTRLVCASRNGQLLYQMDDTEIERLGTECLCDYNSGPKKDNAKDGKIGGRPTPTQWNQLEIVLREMDVWSAETFSYTLEDNSQVVNNRNYFDLARQSTKDTAVTKSVIGALHFGQNEDNRVYFLCDGHEYVLYDFTAEVGDTLQIFAGINNYPQDSVYTHVVTSKKTSDDGVCQMWLEVVFPDEANATIDNAQKVWEAGLGSLDGIVHNAAKRASNARSSETEASIMLCAWREDDCLYTTTHLDFDGYDYGCVYNQEPTSIKDVLAPTSAKKILRDGRMYIYTNGTIYTIIGQKVSENF